MLSDDETEIDLTLNVSEPEAGSCVVELSGDLDLAGSAALDEALAQLPSDSELVIDLSGIEFIDSSGIRSLMVARTRRPTRFVEPSRAVRHTFEVANVLHLLEAG